MPDTRSLPCITPQLSQAVAFSAVGMFKRDAANYRDDIARLADKSPGINGWAPQQAINRCDATGPT
jgi:hypothetical protein